MEVNKSDLEGNKVKLEVTIDKDEVNMALDQAYKKVVKDVELPGFRKGKIPRKVLEARFGKEVLHSDALDILIPKNYSQAVEESGIEPIDQPEIDDYYIAEDEPASFSAEVEVKPEVELGEYTGFDIEMEEVTVEEEEIEAQLERLKQENTQLLSADRTDVQFGDHVVIDFTGYIDGETFPGGSAEEYVLEIGSKSFIPGFEEELIGKNVREEPYEIEVTFPEDYQAEDLAGKDAVFEVIIKEIKEKEEPELDDEFIAEMTEFETLEEYKEDLRETLLEEKEHQQQHEIEDKIIEKAAENAEVNVPEKLIEDELDQMFQQMAQNMQSQGINIQDYFEHLDIDQEEWRSNNRDIAAKRARNNLVLEAIAAEEEIEVEEEELEERLTEIAEANDQDLEQVKAFFQMQGQLEMMKKGLKMEKTIDFLRENN